MTITSVLVSFFLLLEKQTQGNEKEGNKNAGRK